MNLLRTNSSFLNIKPWFTPRTEVINRPELSTGMNGLIQGYVGPEGSGKTLVMTHDADRCREAGMAVFTFPGYQLKDLSGEVVSKELKPEDWINLPDYLNNVVICIDEMPVFFPVIQFASVMTRLFVQIGLQRRKRSLSILYTVQNWGMIPPDIRFLTHNLMFCKDMFFGRQYSKVPIQRGTEILCRKMDMKGFYTGREGWLSPPRPLIHAERIWKLYGSYDIVDILAGFVKVNIKKRELTVGDTATPDGFNIEGSERDFLRNNLPGEGEYQLTSSHTEALIGAWIDEVRKQGVGRILTDTVFERLNAMGIHGERTEIGKSLRKYGVTYRHSGHNSYYVFE